MPADGGEPTRLTSLENGANSVAWSPDGERLAFVSPVGGQREPESDEERRKSRPARIITSLKYRFNGEGFVYDRRPHVFVVALDGAAPRQLTDGDFIDADPAWTPDGQSVVFVSARHAERDEDDASDLWRVPAGGGAPEKLTATPGPIMLPAFSPDGGTIAFLARPGRNAFGRNIRAFTISANGGEAVCLTSALDRSFGAVHRARVGPPAGGSVIGGAEDPGDIGLWRVAARSGEAPRRIVGGERVLNSYSLSADGRQLTFAASSVAAPAEVFVCGTDGSGER